MDIVLLLIYILGGLVVAAALVYLVYGVACESAARGDRVPGWDDRDISDALAGMLRKTREEGKNASHDNGGNR